MARNNLHEKNLRIVQLAMIIAIMVVLQIFGAALVRVAITVPALVLIPLYIGSAAFGKKYGAILGGVFGVITLLLGVTGFDAYTNGLFLYKPLATAVICLGKGIMAGFLSAVVYEALMKLFKNKLFPAALISAAVTPVVNTGLYVLGVYVFFKEYSGFAADSTFFYVIGAVFMMIIVNFLVEVAMNAICCPILVSILARSKHFKKLLIK
ncbi:MAG: hypothetical protein IKK26_04695 [Clostridia bacterium]|nr:hypothetical protein [Clostridia bacterium]MBR6651487.1 hypothetical protein [Clostridia bacterium]